MCVTGGRVGEGVCVCDWRGVGREGVWVSGGE